MTIARRLERLEGASTPPEPEAAASDADPFYADSGWIEAAPDAVLLYYAALAKEVRADPRAETDRGGALEALHARHPLLLSTIHRVQCVANRGTGIAPLRFVQRQMVQDAWYNVSGHIQRERGRFDLAHSDEALGMLFPVPEAELEVSRAAHGFSDEMDAQMVALWRLHGTRDPDTLLAAGLAVLELALLAADEGDEDGPT